MNDDDEEELQENRTSVLLRSTHLSVHHRRLMIKKMSLESPVEMTVCVSLNQAVI